MDFRFSILVGEKTCAQEISNLVSFSCSDNPKSKIENPKWAGLCPRYRLRRIGGRGGGTASENPPDRVLECRLPFHDLGPHRGVQAGSARAWLSWRGKNIVIEWRYADGKLDRLPALAAELVRSKSMSSSRRSDSNPCRQGSNYYDSDCDGRDDDPVGSGFVASLAQPGGNITGLSALSPEISGKQLELLKEIVPKLSRVAVFGTSTRPGNAQMLKETELAAGALKVQLQYLDVLDPKNIETAFLAASKGRAGAVLVLGAPSSLAQRTQIADLAVKSRLPAIYPQRGIVEDGGLMTYGASINDLFRRAATYVDKILKGESPPISRSSSRSSSSSSSI